MQRDGDITLITLSGEVDTATAEVMQQAVSDALASGCTTIVLDMAGVAFIDSSGVTQLVVASVAAKNAGAGFEVRSPSRTVRDVLAVTGLDSVLGPRPGAG